MDTFWRHRSVDTNRWWFYWRSLCLALELSWPSFRFSFSIDTDGDYTASLCLLGQYLSVESRPLAKKIRRMFGDVRNTFQIYWFEGGLWFSVWSSDFGSGSRDPWWRRTYNLDFADLIFGNSEFSSQTVKTVNDVVIPLPDGSYKATVKIEKRTWKRPRWFSETGSYVNVEIVGDVPKFPGKGENSWDCGDDGIWSMSAPGKSVADAVAVYVGLVLNYREKRQGIAALLDGEEEE